MRAEVGVGGGDDADVHLDRLVVADALELALLQHAQQLHLQRHAHRAHFVEEERAAMRLFEPALPRADGAGERAAHVAEDLGLEQVLRDRAAVERDEPLRRARAGVMDRARDDFLAGAGLAADENRARRARDGLERLKQIAHRPAASDDALEAVPLLQLLAQPGVLGLQPPLLDGAVERVPQLVELERLGHKVGGAALDDFDGIPDRAVAGDARCR